MKSIIEFSANLWESIKNFEDVFGVKTMKIEGKIEKINWNPLKNRWACQVGDGEDYVWVSIFMNDKVPTDLKERIQSLKVGDEVEIDAYKSQNGRWLNIKDIIPCRQIDEEIEEELEGEVPFEEASKEEDEQGEQVSLRDILISRQVALKAAVEWAAAYIQAGHKVGGDSICKIAQMFEEYILRK